MTQKGIRGVRETQVQRRQKKQRVCYFVHGQGVGGASLSLLYLIQQLDRERYFPIALFLSESRMCEIFREHGIETRVVHGMKYFSHTTGEHVHLGNPRGFWQLAMFLPSVWQTYRLVRRLRPDIVHLNSSTLAPQAIGAKLAGAKVVWQIREHVLDGHLGLRRKLHKWVGRHCADAMIFILKSEAERLGCPGKTHVIYNFVDFSIFDRRKRDARVATGQPNPKTVTLLGGVSKIKGALEFVRAYPLVRDRLGAVRFLIVGYDGRSRPGGRFINLLRKLRETLTGPGYAHQVHEYAARHCDGEVTFTGVVEDVPSILAETDLVVFPSTVAHFARPVIEAGAMAIPVVASDLEGPRELVIHGETGMLVPPGAPEALAKAIVTVLSDDDLARRMGEQGYERARRLFNAQTNSAATFAIYEQLLQDTDGVESECAASSSDFGTDDTRSSDTQADPQPDPIKLQWAIVFLAWMTLVFGIYFYKWITMPGRLEKLMDLLQSLLR